MSTRTLTVAFLMLSPALANAQTIYGAAAEDSTETPIAGALVELLTLKGRRVTVTQTDTAGGFRLHAGSKGIFRVRLTHPFYATVQSDTISLRRDEVIALQVRLAPAAIPLDPLEVVSRRRDKLANFYNRVQNPGFGRFVTRAEIEVRPGARGTDLLRMEPSIEIVRTPGIGGASLITMRGGGRGRCQPTLFIDGLKVRQFPESGIDDFIRAETLEGIEIYPRSAGVPPEFQDGNPCGAVAFWTRPLLEPLSMRPPSILAVGAFAVLIGLTSLLAN